MKISVSQAELDLILTAIEITTAHIEAHPESGLNGRPFCRLGERLQYLFKVCSNCGDPSRRSSGLCDPCHAYERKYGRLPDHEVLRKRRRGAA